MFISNTYPFVYFLSCSQIEKDEAKEKVEEYQALLKKAIEEKESANKNFESMIDRYER